MRGGTREGHGIVRGRACVGPQASGWHRVCYAVPGRAKVEASDAVITCMILICHCSNSILFDPGST